MAARYWRLLSVVATGLGCGAESAGPGPDTSDPLHQISIDPAEIDLGAVGDTSRLIATGRTRSGKSAVVKVTWSTLEPAVAVVDTSGLVTAVTNGATRITAAAQGTTLADTTLVTVRQRAATIEITPGEDTVVTGATRQYTAQVRDRRGQPIAGAALRWASSDTAIAVVDANGLVRGRAKGAAEITAQADTATGRARTEVRNPRLVLSSDTALAGTLLLDAFTVAAGRTVTLGGDLRLLVDGPMTVEGNLSGDCVAIEAFVTGAVRVGGKIDNGCRDSTKTGKHLWVYSTGVLDFGGAELRPAGETILANDTAFALSRAEPGAQSSPALATTFCAAPARLQPYPAARGLHGSPRGAPGGRGAAVTSFRCAGDLLVQAAVLAGQDGGRGGRGSSDNAEPAVGGHGGSGGGLILRASQRIVFDGANELHIGRGGAGGQANADVADAPATAQGGDGGDTGTLIVRAPVIRVDGQVGVYAGPSEGGHAVARGADGADAGAAAARPGWDATATGGGGGDLGDPRGLRLIGDLFVGQVTGSVFTVSLFVASAWATAWGGNGGTGNDAFPDGASGGASRVRGGRGGNVHIVLPNGSAAFRPGYGGAAILAGSNGGNGDDACVPLPTRPGGRGGPGGPLDAAVGAPGTGPGGVAGEPGTIAFDRPAGKGGDGGPGAPGGPAGSRGPESLVGQVVSRPSDVLVDGRPGGPCATGFGVSVTLRADPDGIHNQVRFDQVGQLDVLISVEPNGAEKITVGGSTPWIPVAGPMLPDGSFRSVGTGNLAGGPAFVELVGQVIRSAGVVTDFVGDIAVRYLNKLATYHVTKFP